MAATVDELTITYVEDGITTVKELDKVILTKGAWSTVLFKYQDWEKAKNAYSHPRYSLRRYQKRDGVYRLQSKFNISSTEQAAKIIEALQGWMDQDPKGDE